MTDFDPFEQSLHDAFSRGDVDDDAGFAAVVSRGRTKQRRRTMLAAGVTGGIAVILLGAILATGTPGKTNVETQSPFGSNGIAATTSTASSTTTTVPGQRVVPPRHTQRPGGTTSTTPSGECPAVSGSVQRGVPALTATAFFDHASAPGATVNCTLSIANTTNDTVVGYLDLGTVFVDASSPNGDVLVTQQVANSDAPKYVVFCGAEPYLVVPPQTTINETGTISTANLSGGTQNLTLWTQHQGVNVEQFGGPGGVLIIGSTETTTTLATEPTTTTTGP